MVAELGIARFGEPEDIARLTAFVLGAPGSFLQGALIDMDGGQTRTI
jgi:NAD(P)-dependent dehydrogenase (short-subunit alcohol dehydrogenase family)